MHIFFIRHLKTQGNLEKRYIGTTDESIISTEAQNQLLRQMQDRIQKRTSVELVVTSPLKRCVETAEIYFPSVKRISKRDFRETDFGRFENKNYEELRDVAEYREWLDSNGTLPFPGGESRGAFQQRCRRCFEETINQLMEQKISVAAFVVHGGTIMAILSQFSENPSEFYDWMTKNGEGYQMWIDEQGWKSGRKQLKEIDRI